jgi:MYXO-CTERM domain-containing protein
LCDGWDDCELGEDELHCGSMECEDGTLVEATAVCDGTSDCELGEDEANCPSPAALVETRNATAAECAHGGSVLKVGYDRNDNGKLDKAEITDMRPVCNGAPGEPGVDGVDGAPGAQGPAGERGSRGKEGGCSVRGRGEPASGLLLSMIVLGALVRRRRSRAA